MSNNYVHNPDCGYCTASGCVFTDRAQQDSSLAEQLDPTGLCLHPIVHLRRLHPELAFAEEGRAHLILHPEKDHSEDPETGRATA